MPNYMDCLNAFVVSSVIPKQMLHTFDFSLEKVFNNICCNILFQSRTVPSTRPLGPAKEKGRPTLQQIDATTWSIYKRLASTLVICSPSMKHMTLNTTDIPIAPVMKVFATILLMN